MDPATLRVRLDERGRLYVIRERMEDQQIIARRAFPWSRPETFISLRDKDGHELLMLESLDALPPEAREVVGRFLSSSTFIPKIIRVDKVDVQHGFQLWDVQTEAGPAQLRVQEREDIRFLSDTRFSVKDANGNLYEIADVRLLDEASQRELSRVV